MRWAAVQGEEVPSNEVNHDRLFGVSRVTEYLSL
jgi:hypothetical protein